MLYKSPLDTLGASANVFISSPREFQTGRSRHHARPSPHHTRGRNPARACGLPYPSYWHGLLNHVHIRLRFTLDYRVTLLRPHRLDQHMLSPSDRLLLGRAALFRRDIG
jgi:hypothetical protein